MASPQTHPHKLAPVSPSPQTLSHRVSPARRLEAAREEGQMLNSGRNVFTGLPGEGGDGTKTPPVAKTHTWTLAQSRANPTTLKKRRLEAHNGDLFWSCDFEMGLGHVFERLRLISSPLGSNSVYLRVSTAGLIGD